MSKKRLSVEELELKVKALGITLVKNGNKAIVKKGEVKKLVDEGITRSELAEIYGLSMANMNAVLKQLGLTPARIEKKFIIVDDDFATTPDAEELANTDDKLVHPASTPDRLDSASDAYVKNAGLPLL